MDDEPAMRRVLKRLLSEEGHEIWTAPSAAGAREVLGSHPVDVVLTDLNMPEESGIQLTAWLKEHHPRVGVIVVSVEHDEERAAKLVELGVFGYIQKPFHATQVKLQVAIALRHRELAIGLAAHMEELERRVEARTAQLAARERQFRQLAEHAGELIWVIDEQCRVYYTSPSVRRTLGPQRKGADQTDIELARVLGPGPAARVSDTIPRLLAEHARIPTAMEHLTLEAHDESGKPVVLEASLTVLGSREGEQSRRIMAIARDETERRRAEQDATQTHKMEAIGTLAAGIAHELNTPSQYVIDNLSFLGEGLKDLTPVLQQCQRLSESGKAAAAEDGTLDALIAASEAADIEFLLEDLGPAVAQSQEGMQRVAEIVRAMKAFSHPGRAEGVQATDLNAVIGNCVTLCRNEWKYHSDLSLELDPDLPAVPCVPGEIGQVVLNLVVNAAHAVTKRVEDGDSPNARGRIAVRSRVVGPWAEIQVQDSGCGISAKHQHRVFEPFFTTKPVGRGTGQGLTLARTVITEKHHGELTFESEEGVGTTFYVRLPLQGSSPGDQRG